MQKIKHKKVKQVDILDKNCTVRLDKKELHKRFTWISELGACQVCETSYNLDIPHHARYGIGNKDDRFLINICVDCHREIHNGSYSNLDKTRKQLENIGWENHLLYLGEIK